MSRRNAVIAGFATLLLAAPGALAGGAEDFAGTFVRSASAAETQAIDAAVDKAAEAFNPLIRFVARGRLANAAKLPTKLLIAVKGSDLSITKDSQPVRTTRTDGGTLVFTHDGKQTKLTRQIAGNGLTEIARTDDGARTLVYSFGNGGQTLILSATIESNQLKAPMHVSATYRRSGR
jgi:hypothetical protein